MRAKFIYEKFTEESDPIHDMNIGVRFGFTMQMVGLEKNDGRHNFFVNQRFIDLYCQLLMPNSFILKKDFRAIFNRHGWKSSCAFYFKPVGLSSLNENPLYYVQGMSGSMGFNGGEQDKKHYMRPTTLKNVLGQLYQHLEKL